MVKYSNNQQKGQQKDPKNMKNFYVKKINSLVNTTSDYQAHISPKTDMKRSISAKDSVDRVQQRREKNRQSARRARQRKKLYVNLLEYSVSRLQAINNEGDAALIESEKFYTLLSDQRGRQIKVQNIDDVFCLGDNDEQKNQKWIDKLANVQEVSNEIKGLIKPNTNLLRNISQWQFFSQKISELQLQMSSLSEKVEGLKMQSSYMPTQFQARISQDRLYREFQTFLMKENEGKSQIDFNTDTALQCLTKIQAFRNRNLDI